MAGLSFVLLGIIALAVDGSGLFLDKARFTQGLEQGALALVAENNAYRQNKKHDDVLRQKVGGSFTSNAEKLSAQQEKRNQELLRDIARHYYSSGYLRESQEIEDNYQFECKELANRSVVCQVSGNFSRPSWLYIPSNDNHIQFSFVQEVNIVSDILYAQKTSYQKNLPPHSETDKELLLDVMFVLDMSGSMREFIKYQSKRKINILVDEVKRLSSLVFENHPSNRVGYVGYGYGARQNNTTELCVMPYEIDYDLLLKDDPLMGKAWYLWLGGGSPRGYYEINKEQAVFGRIIPPYADHDATLDLIDSFDGQPISGFYKYPKCVLKYNTDAITTDLWFSQKDKNKFDRAMDRLRYISSEDANVPDLAGTLSTAGLLVGANLILNDQGFHNYQGTSNEIRRKVLIIISDGMDEDYYAGTEYERPMVPVTKKFLDKGICERIRRKWHSTQSPLIAPSIIGFIALGYDSTNVNEWKKCTDGGYYVANSQFALSEVLNEILDKAKVPQNPRVIVFPREEVGHSLNSKPLGWK